MTEDEREGEKGSEAKPGHAPKAPAPTPTESAAENLNRQNKTKDKPSSGQNEDG